MRFFTDGELSTDPDTVLEGLTSGGEAGITQADVDAEIAAVRAKKNRT